MAPTTKTYEQDNCKTEHARIWVSWSSGKDSYAVLRELIASDSYKVDCMFTVVDFSSSQIPMHAVSIDLLKQQVEALGLDHRLIALGDNNQESGFLTLLNEARNSSVNQFAFGDLFLEEIRSYRENNMSDTGIGTIFPLWHRQTDNLIIDLINSGMRAIITSVDLTKLPASFLGRELTLELVKEIVDMGFDPCGEHGEFHSFVFDGPLFRHPVDFEITEPVIGDDFAHLPLISVI